MANLKITDRKQPTYKDGFFEVSQLIDSWNENMANVFSPSWISCLDESMSKWLNNYTCSGFMDVPRKPWSFGNEYHSICCSLCGIIYAIEIVEGKDEPPQRPSKEHAAIKPGHV